MKLWPIAQMYPTAYFSIIHKPRHLHQCDIRNTLFNPNEANFPKCYCRKQSSLSLIDFYFQKYTHFSILNFCEKCESVLSFLLYSIFDLVPWPARPKLFAIWPFREKVCCPLPCTVASPLTDTGYTSLWYTRLWDRTPQSAFKNMGIKWCNCGIKEMF